MGHNRLAYRVMSSFLTRLGAAGMLFQCSTPLKSLAQCNVTFSIYPRFASDKRICKNLTFYASYLPCLSLIKVKWLISNDLSKNRLMHCVLNVFEARINIFGAGLPTKLH